MSRENTHNSALVIVLSIFGILAVALLGGLLLMQKQETGEIDLSDALSLNKPDQPVEDIDPYTYVNDDAAYPSRLEKPEETAKVEMETELQSDDALPSDVEAVWETPSIATETALKDKAAKAPAVPAIPRKAAPASSYNKVSENAYWIQVFSSTEISRAEEIRNQMATYGMPATVQLHNVDGLLRYRVRVGAFGSKAEAQSYVNSLRNIQGFESSYVVKSPVIRSIPAD